MKNIAIFAILLLTVGCVTSKRCSEKFPPTVISTVDTIHVIEYRDTIIEKYLPGDTVYSVEQIVVTDTVIKVLRPVEAETELANAKAWIDNDLLRLRLIQKDSILRFKLDSAIRVSSDTITITTVETKTVEVKKAVTKYATFWVIIVLWFLSMLVCVTGLFRK
jgi:hypothetical protein